MTERPPSNGIPRRVSCRVSPPSPSPNPWLTMTNLLRCKTCGKGQTDPSVKLRKCSKCRGSAYCSKRQSSGPLMYCLPTRCFQGVDCQRKDWPAHKRLCGGWYDKYRKCQDGAKHEGQLELITWVCEEDQVGFGACWLDECDDLKETFETEFEGNLEEFYEYRPHAFRWTCCGMAGSNKYGCDHHGTGSKPCSCDFCRRVRGDHRPLPHMLTLTL